MSSKRSKRPRRTATGSSTSRSSSSDVKRSETASSAEATAADAGDSSEMCDSGGEECPREECPRDDVLAAISAEVDAIHRLLGVNSEEYESVLKIKEGRSVHYEASVKPSETEKDSRIRRRMQRLKEQLGRMGSRYRGFDYGKIEFSRKKKNDGGHQWSFDVTASERCEE